MPGSAIAIVSADWRSQFLDGLAPSDRKRILLAAKPRRIAANSVITGQGNPADHLFLLTHGRARFFFDAQTGQHVILHWLGPGELIGGSLTTVTLPLAPAAVGAAEVSGGHSLARPPVTNDFAAVSGR